MSTTYIPLPSRTGTLSGAGAALKARLSSWRQAYLKAAERRALASKLAELRDRDPRLFAELGAGDIELPATKARAVPLLPCTVIASHFIGGGD